jgi:hypothetical protein
MYSDDNIHLLNEFVAYCLKDVLTLDKSEFFSIEKEGIAKAILGFASIDQLLSQPEGFPAQLRSAVRESPAWSEHKLEWEIVFYEFDTAYKQRQQERQSAEGEDDEEEEKEPTGEAEGQPAGEAEGQPTGEAEGQPAGEAEGQPAGEAEGQPAGEAEGQPAGEAEGDEEDQEAARVVRQVKAVLVSIRTRFSFMPEVTAFFLMLEAKTPVGKVTTGTRWGIRKLIAIWDAIKSLIRKVSNFFGLPLALVVLDRAMQRSKALRIITKAIGTIVFIILFVAIFIAWPVYRLWESPQRLFKWIGREINFDLPVDEE